MSWSKQNKKWHVQVRHLGKNRQWFFDSLEEAGRFAVHMRNQLFTHNDADRDEAMGALTRFYKTA